MRHLRSDYDAIQPWPVKRPHTVKIGGAVEHDVHESAADNPEVEPLIPEDEPVFLLRGQDPVACAVVRLYAQLALTMGSDGAMCQRIVEWAQEMENYAAARQHGAPDVPEGMLR